MPQNEKENVCTTETKPVDPEVGDITQQLLVEQNGGITNDDEVEEITCRISQEEKVLYKHLERIKNIYQMISEIYKNGPTRGLTPIPDRPPIPFVAIPKSVYPNNKRSRTGHNKQRQRNDRRQIIDK